jgi:hypothetical protein
MFLHKIAGKKLFARSCCDFGQMKTNWTACCHFLMNVLKKQRASVDRLDVKEFEVNLHTRFAEEEGLQLEQGIAGAASTGVQAGNWLEDAAADQMEQMNAGASSALRMLPV